MATAGAASRADEEDVDNTVDVVELEGDDDAMFPMAVSNQSNKLDCSRIVTRDETSTVRVMQYMPNADKYLIFFKMINFEFKTTFAIYLCYLASDATIKWIS